MADECEKGLEALVEEESGYYTESTSATSNSSSICSSVWNFQYENGRRYHSFREGQYVLPNDETEQNRLDLLHHIMLMFTGGKLYIAPIGKYPERILDIGCGTGIWAIDVATDFPSTEVIGTDLSPIQPGWVPPNCRFEVDDAESPWVYPPDHFDFIHSRHMAGSIANWPQYIQSIYNHTKPGGWIECVEFQANLNSDDGTHKAGSALARYFAAFNEAAGRLGRVMDMAHDVKRFVQEAGFVDVVEVRKKLPWSPWPKDKKLRAMGKYTLLQCESSFEAYGLALLTRVGGMDDQKARELCSAAKAEVSDKSIHVYNYHYWVYGRKPAGNEVVASLEGRTGRP